MKQREESDQYASLTEEARAAVRKPYQKPAVRYERIFETSALACGKVQTRTQSCRVNRKNS